MVGKVGRRGAGEDGQSLVEFILVFAVVAAVVAALVLARPNAAEVARDGSASTVCKILNDDNCDRGGGSRDVAQRDVGETRPVQPGERAPGQPAPGASTAPQGQQSGGGQTDRATTPASDGGGADQGGREAPRGNVGVGFARGFAAQMVDELKGIGETFKWIFDLFTDSQTRAEFLEMLRMIARDPLGFASQVFRGLWQPIMDEINAGRAPEAVGRTAAMILMAVFGGKGLNKLRQLNPDVDALLRRLDPSGQADLEADIRRRMDCVTNSFTADTAVLLADGSVLPIGQVEVGDLVLAADPLTGEVGARPVSELIVGSGVKELVDVSVGGATLTATGGHPFWLPDTAEWVDAADLRPGDDLLTATGTEATVTAVAARTATLTVHNLTVADLHTYYTLAGPHPLLVHNAEPDCTPEVEGSWVLPRAGGGAEIEGRWFTEHALERMAPDTPEVRALLESRALDRARAAGLEPGTPEFQAWWRQNGPDPRGIPPSVILAEIANPGSTNVRVITNVNGDVVTVIPRGAPPP